MRAYRASQSPILSDYHEPMSITCDLTAMQYKQAAALGTNKDCQNFPSSARVFLTQPADCSLPSLQPLPLSEHTALWLLPSHGAFQCTTQAVAGLFKCTQQVSCASVPVLGCGAYKLCAKACQPSQTLDWRVIHCPAVPATPVQLFLRSYLSKIRCAVHHGIRSVGSNHCIL